MNFDVFCAPCLQFWMGLPQRDKELVHSLGVMVPVPNRCEPTFRERRCACQAGCALEVSGKSSGSAESRVVLRA